MHETDRRTATMTPFDRVMQAYGMMVNLTPEQEEDARDRLRKFLELRTGTDQELAVEGLQFLRGTRATRRRRSAMKREVAEAL
jgi:hypothetical protein